LFDELPIKEGLAAASYRAAN